MPSLSVSRPPMKTGPTPDDDDEDVDEDDGGDEVTEEETYPVQKA